MSVTVSGFYLKDTIFNSQERDIESATTKVKNENIALTFALLVKTVGNSSGGGLIDNTLDVKSRNSSGILSSLSL